MSNHLRWTSTLLRSLFHSGVRHAILSPGSRSTPLTIAAAIHPGLTKRVVLDERSAAFIALGIGKVTGIPAVLTCTSGTAVANYMPAVVEAKESGVPMIVLSADRPPNLRGIGSSQTVDQIKIFGDQAVFFHETGEPQFDDQDLKRISYLGKQAVNEAIQKGGVAHINLAFRKPLEPTESEIKAEKETINNSIQEATFRKESVTRVLNLNEQIQNLLVHSKQPLAIAGPANSHHALHAQLLELLEKFELPLLAEPGSRIPISHHFIHRYEQFLRADRNQKELKPDLILRFGDQPYTKSLLTVLEKWSDVPVVHFSARTSTQDHALHVDHFVHCAQSDKLIWPENFHSPDKHWMKKWTQLEHESQIELDKKMKLTTEFTDGHIFQTIARTIDSNWNIMLSNSFIPRDMALFGKPNPLQVVNRGAAGIDGIISTALGVHYGSNKPTLCVTGDLAFLHDSNALLSIKKTKQPFAIVVVNNGGGNIFKMLPIHQNEQLFTDYFQTPQQAEIEHIARAHQINYHKITSVKELADFDFQDNSFPIIIECITDSAAGMNLRKSLWS